MRKIFTIVAFALLTAGVWAQSPQKMSYQAVIRNAANTLVTNQSIGMRVSILQGSATGTVVYRETYSPNPQTNSNGMVILEIGGGIPATGTFAGINWASGPYFIKTETDPAGGTNYSITASNQLLSVPYALYSANGGLAPGSAAGNTPYWNGSTWVINSSNIFNNGGNIGIGTATPSTKLDIAGGNNWDLQNGEGDFRLGNSQHRLKIGVATDGGGAGAVGIMQYGHEGGFNVLSMGAQGNFMLFLNGGSKRVGIGIGYPAATLDVHGTLSVVDGTQGAGKLLTSDANGLASWADLPVAKAHFIGESYGGGKIFYVYDNGKHGLIAATADQSTGVRWYAGTLTNTMALADGINAGKANTVLIIASQGFGDGGTYAARICNEYQLTVGGDTYGDWYLPSKFELNLLYLQKTTVGGFTNNEYWSSTEFNDQYVWFQNFNTGTQVFSLGELPTKWELFSVRAIRSF